MTTRPQFNPFEKGANHRLEAARTLPLSPDPWEFLGHRDGLPI